MSNSNVNLNMLFEALNENGIFYFLFREFNSNAEGDVDLYVHHDSKELFLDILRKLGWLQRREPPRDKLHNFYYHISDKPICLDVYYELRFGSNGAYLQFCGGDCPPRILTNDGFYRPRGDYLLLFLLAHIHSEKKEVSDKELTRWQNYYNLFYLEDKKEMLLNWFVVDENIENNISKIDSQKIFKKIDLSNYRSKHNLKKCFNLLFIGTDGTGKTTLIKNLKAKINIKCIQLYFGQKEWALEITSLLHKQQGFWHNQFFRYIAYPLDIILRRYKKSCNGIYLSLIDRFPGRGYMQNKVLRFFYKLALPKVDMIVFLTGNAEIICSRKNECDINRFEREQKKWLETANMFCDEILQIDTSLHEIGESVECIIKKLPGNNKFLGTFFKEIENE